MKSIVLVLIAMAVNGCIDQNTFHKTKDFDQAFIKGWNLLVDKNEQIPYDYNIMVNFLKVKNSQIQFIYKTRMEGSILFKDTLYSVGLNKLDKIVYLRNHIDESEGIGSGYILSKKFNLYEEEEGKHRIELVDYSLSDDQNEIFRVVWIITDPNIFFSNTF